MKNTKLFISTIAVLLLTTLAGFVVGNKFADSKKKIVSDADFLFKQAILQYHNRRLKEIGYLYFKDNPISHDWPKEKIVFVTEQGERVQTNIDSIRALPEEEKVKIVRETLLLDDHPINPDSLNACFQGILQQRDIPVSTNIRYTEVYNNKIQYSGTDTTFFASAHPLEEYKTGIFNEITVQAYVRIPLITVMEEAGMRLGIPIFVWLGILVVYILHMYKAIRKKKTADDPSEENRTGELLWLDSGRPCLHYKDQEVVLTPTLVRLVSLFLKNPDYFVTKEEIINKLGGGVEDPSNRITQIISRLRSKLARFSDLEIRTERGAGYRIVVSVLGESLEESIPPKHVSQA
jgi:DNA-binding winged helix-turn-helix (wHTH) protein